MNHITEMWGAYQEVQLRQQLLNDGVDLSQLSGDECLYEGAIADKLRAMQAAKKKDWDEKSDKAKSDAYKALKKAKETQAAMDNSDYINNVKEGYKNIDRKTGEMAKKAALASQEAGIRQMGGKAAREGGLRNAVRKAVGLSPKERSDRENPENPKKEQRARERASKILAVMSTHKPGIAQDREAINRETGSRKSVRSAKNSIKKTERKLTREDFVLAMGTLLGEGFAETTSEALYMISMMEDISFDLIDTLID